MKQQNFACKEDGSETVSLTLEYPFQILLSCKETTCPSIHFSNLIFWISNSKPKTSLWRQVFFSWQKISRKWELIRHEVFLIYLKILLLALGIMSTEPKEIQLLTEARAGSSLSSARLICIEELSFWICYRTLWPPIWFL